jgi:hypothetical protein
MHKDMGIGFLGCKALMLFTYEIRFMEMAIKTPQISLP